MFIYILISEHWEDYEILGVYASIEAAKGTDPKLTWKETGDGGAYLDGLKYGFATVIERHEVKA